MFIKMLHLKLYIEAPQTFNMKVYYLRGKNSNIMTN